MGGFEQKASKVASTIPSDVPNATEAASAPEGFDGAIYKANNGTRYRLRHARWVEVKPRAAKKTAAKK